MAPLATAVTASHFLSCYHHLPGRCLQAECPTLQPARLSGREVSVHRVLCVDAAVPGAGPVGSRLHSGEPSAGGSLEITCNTQSSHNLCFWAVKVLIAHHGLSFLIPGLVSLTIAHATPIYLQWGAERHPITHCRDAHCKIVKAKLVVKEIKLCSNLKYSVIS